MTFIPWKIDTKFQVICTTYYMLQMCYVKVMCTSSELTLRMSTWPLLMCLALHLYTDVQTDVNKPKSNHLAFLYFGTEQRSRWATVSLMLSFVYYTTRGLMKCINLINKLIIAMVCILCPPPPYWKAFYSVCELANIWKSCCHFNSRKKSIEREPILFYEIESIWKLTWVLKGRNEFMTHDSAIRTPLIKVYLILQAVASVCNTNAGLFFTSILYFPRSETASFRLLSFAEGLKLA